MKVLALQLAALLLLCAVPRSGYSFNRFFDEWMALYPGSATGQNVVDGTGRPCALCHQGDNGDGFNAYGWQIVLGLDAGLTVSQAILASEGYDSDLDPTASDNLNEISVHTQPGWTDGPFNRVYFFGGQVLDNQPPPDTILGLMDPSGTVECVMHADCDDGMFCNGEEICDAVGSCQPGVPPCGPDETCDEAGGLCIAAPVCTLDDDCNDGLFCNGAERCESDGLCGTGYPPCAADETCDEVADVCEIPLVDVDIAGLRATRRVALARVKPVTVKLVVRSASPGPVEAVATLSGIQNGRSVYSASQTIMIPADKRRASFVFSYTPTEAGTITWTAILEDEDPDLDEATTMTNVR